MLGYMQEKTIISPEIKLQQWGEGEWINEPDFVRFDYKGFACAIKRVAVWKKGEPDQLLLGHLSGYVAIPKEHPLYKKEYPEIDIDCHGGLSFSEEDDLDWWIGFDCARSNDIMPYIEKMKKKFGIDNSPIFNKTYRNISYVKAQCESIVDQLIEMKK